MSLVNLIVTARSIVADWRRREQAFAELMALDDRALGDIGLHRSEIHAAIDRMSAARAPATAATAAPAPYANPKTA
jgi:uncharacterized protein YjiS (DUF1127 family)